MFIGDFALMDTFYNSLEIENNLVGIYHGIPKENDIDCSFILNTSIEFL